MKHTVTLLAFTPLLAIGQSLVSSSPQDRSVLLEDFTGIHCGYCPEGHVIMEALETQHGARLATIGIHAGPFATPATGEPDFRTTPGTAIDAYFTIGGYPAGVINRRLFGGLDDLGRGAWEGAVAEVLELPSPVNMGVASTFDEGTRELTVTVELLYTADSPAGTDFISVLLKENHITGPQTDYGPAGNHTDYDHKNVLRTYITDTWGDPVSTTTAGTSVLRTYSYTVPADWNASNCEVLAFVSEDHSEVYQAREVAAIGGTTLVVGELSSADPAFVGGSIGAVSTFNGTLVNNLGATAQYQVTLTSYGSPASWSSELMANGSPLANPGTVELVADASLDLDVLVTPDATPGIGRYLLSVASINDPGAPVLELEYNVISGVTDLIVTHTGAEPWEQLYRDGLDQAGNQSYAATTKDKFIRFGEEDALTNVMNLYMNISWTFPALTDDEVAVLTAHMDGGGDVMFAGQDIGWDQSGATGSYGTPITQAFFADYMHASYVADGSTANSSVNFFDADPVFGALPNTTIANVFNNNTYPEEITPIAPAVGILHYTTNVNKIGALRCDNNTFKVVYFGVGPEQMSNAATGRSMISISHDWFYGFVTVEEFDAYFSGQLGQAFPVPANDRITIPLNDLKATAQLEVLDITGRSVASHTLPAGATRFDLDVTGLSNGIYRYALRSPDGMSPARAFQVQR
ncbi:MAG: Omp28-related outer membrane protein [Flavobacteriales bacterium]|nr:Omp28-related outer membrane protein [Flavobacteriales bacterium]